MNKMRQQLRNVKIPTQLCKTVMKLSIELNYALISLWWCACASLCIIVYGCLSKLLSVLHLFTNESFSYSKQVYNAGIEVSIQTDIVYAMSYM